jgi:hypothetical protein
LTNPKTYVIITPESEVKNMNYPIYPCDTTLYGECPKDCVKYGLPAPCNCCQPIAYSDDFEDDE